jgi:hypothetical protein
MAGEGKPPRVDAMKCYMMGPHRVGCARAVYWPHGPSLDGEFRFCYSKYVFNQFLLTPKVPRARLHQNFVSETFYQVLGCWRLQAVATTWLA